MASSRYQAPVAVLGLTETLRALDSMDRRTRRNTRRELLQAAVEIRDLAKTYVDPNGLSGWKKWKGGYKPSAIEAGIRLTNLNQKRYNTLTRSYIAVVNSTAAGAIWEVSGRKSADGMSGGRKARKGRRQRRARVFTEGRNGTMGWHYRATGEQGGTFGNGEAFIRGIAGKGGRASRTVWAAHDQTNAGFIKRRIEQMLIREGKTTQAAIDRNAY